MESLRMMYLMMRLHQVNHHQMLWIITMDHYRDQNLCSNSQRPHMTGPRHNSGGELSEPNPIPRPYQDQDLPLNPQEDHPKDILRVPRIYCHHGDRFTRLQNKNGRLSWTLGLTSRRSHISQVRFIFISSLFVLSQCQCASIIQV